MNKYEAMFILKPDLSEGDKKTLFNQLHDTVTKNKGQVNQGAVWQERRKLFFPLKRQSEGLYYLLNFSAPPEAIKEVREAYRINENVLRVLITRQER